MRRARRTVRSRLVDALLDAFTAQGRHARIADDDLQPARGHWRTSPYADVYRWEGYIQLEGTPYPVHLVSWNTMTDCVKRGVEVEYDQSIVAWDVTAKPDPAVAEQVAAVVDEDDDGASDDPDAHWGPA